MAFWVFMLVCDMLTPALMILMGWSLWKHPPKDINSLLGYRTTRSMKNQDTWHFAQEYCGKLWYKLGLLQILPSVVPFAFLLNADEGTVSTVGMSVLFVQMAVLIGAIFPTEAALKRNFDKEGKRI